MRISVSSKVLVSTALLVACCSTVVVVAFAPLQQDPARRLPSLLTSTTGSAASKTSTTLYASLSPTPFQKHLQKAFAMAIVTASLWSAPAFLVSNTGDNILSWLPLDSQQSSVTAVAKEMASGSGSRVNKDPESLLRWGLPINNKEVRKLQITLEEIRLDIGSKRKAAASDGVRKARTIMSNKDAEKMIASCRDAKICSDYLQSMLKGLDPLATAIADSQTYFNGSDQERQALDDAYEAQKQVVDTLTKLEEQMIPAGYRTPVPPEYSDLAQLHGRAVVEMKLVKADPGDTFDVAGQMFKEARLKMIIDGYGSPVTSGNFVDLVQRGFYDKMPIQRSDGFVVQTGKPTTGDAEGFVGRGGRAVGNGPKGERLIPLEIYVKGDAGPIYETTIEDDGRGGQATILPFSSYGAMGWAREEYDPNSGSSQFFWLLFDSDLTPAGKNVLDGRYPCFGYVVDGADFLTDIKEGDVIVSAKVTEGLQNLELPK